MTKLVKTIGQMLDAQGTIPLHSRLGMSSAYRWLHCAGSPREIAKLPPQSAGPAAASGTDQHSMGETCLKRGIDTKGFIGGYVGETRITAEIADAVQTYVTAVRDFVTQMGEGAELHVESRANLTWLHPDLWGTMDAMVTLPFHHAIVVDYKSGGQPVEADCDQGIGYSLFPWHEYDCETVTFVIVQPNAAHSDGPVRAKTYTRSELEFQAARFKAGAEATDKPDAPLIAGPWCKKSYCPMQATCPALHQRALAVAVETFKPVSAEPIKPPAPETLTPEALRKVLDNAEILEGWIRAVWVYALDQAQRGAPPQGWKLVQGRKGARKWDRPEVAAEIIEKAGKDPYEPREVISPAAAEKMLGKPTFATLLELAVKQADGKPELVPETDKRPALAAGPEAVFTPITNETEI